MDLTTLVVNVARDILAAQTLAQVVAIMIGIGYCAHALTQAMKKTAAPGADISGAELFASFFIGALMLHFAGAMGHLWEKHYVERSQHSDALASGGACPCEMDRARNGGRSFSAAALDHASTVRSG